MADMARRRARTIEEFGANMGAIMAHPTTNYRPYEGRPGDVFITCWAKSGTTMMQPCIPQVAWRLR